MVSAKRPCFLQGFDPFSCSERLRVPPKFVQHMEGYTCGRVSLAGPSGDTWHASLIQHGDGLFIHEGWESFVRDHLLEQGDSLVFRYDGNLDFTVQVFDQSSCEKEVAIAYRRKSDNHMGKKREREYALLDNIVEYVPKKMRSAQVPADYIMKYPESKQEKVDRERFLQENVLSMSGKGQDAGCSNLEYLGTPLKDSVTIAVPSGETSGAIVNNDRTLLASEAERIAEAFTSSYPNFIKVMKKFNVSGSYTLNIPYQFSMAHLPNCKVKITIRNVKGESWTVNAVPTTKVQTSHTFCGGWLSFVRDNNINMGDFCIFELMGQCELHVQVLRVRNEGMDCQNSKPARKGFTNGSTASLQTVKENSHKSHVLPMTKAKKSGCNGKHDIRSKNSSQDQQGSYIKSYMSIKSAPEEKVAARSFVSGFPHFVRVMKKFNISGSFTLKVPYQFSMEHLPSCRTEIVLRNLKGQCWTVNSIPTMKVQTLHTLCGGWMAFVRDNDIQMGDICIFELVGKCEMRVHVSNLRKGGQDVVIAPNDSNFGRKGHEYQNGITASSELALVISNRPLLQET